MASTPNGVSQIAANVSDGSARPVASSTNIISETREEVKDFFESKKFQLDLRKWQSEMTEEERTQYDAMQAEVHGLTPIF